jgi:hypothetical protein
MVRVRKSSRNVQCPNRATGFMFDSIFGAVADTVKIVTAPVSVAADIARTVTKPLAEVSEDIVESVKDESNDQP